MKIHTQGDRNPAVSRYWIACVDERSGMRAVTYIVANLGFSIRTLDPIEMFDLYGLQAGLVPHAVTIAIERGSDAEPQCFQAESQRSLEKMETLDPREHVYQNEEFRRRLVKLRAMKRLPIN